MQPAQLEMWLGLKCASLRAVQTCQWFTRTCYCSFWIRRGMALKMPFCLGCQACHLVTGAFMCAPGCSCHHVKMNLAMRWGCTCRQRHHGAIVGWATRGCTPHSFIVQRFCYHQCFGEPPLLSNLLQSDPGNVCHWGPGAENVVLSVFLPLCGNDWLTPW